MKRYLVTAALVVAAGVTFVLFQNFSQPYAPFLFNVQLQADYIDLYWQDRSPAETGFKCQSYESGRFVTKSIVGPSSTSCRVSKPPGGTYYLRVIAVQGTAEYYSNIIKRTESPYPR